MAFAFVHVTPEVKAQGALDRHNRGDARPPEAMTRAEWDHQPTMRIAGDEDRAVKVLADIEASRGRGRPGCQRVRVLFGHPPAFEAEDAWTRDQLLSWAKDSAAWLERKIGEASEGHAVLERCDLHLDETSPHLHASIIPAMPKRPRDRDEAPGVDRGPSKLSWTGLQRAMAAGVTRSESMRAIQDSYFADVGRAYGMERGKSSTRTRAEPDRMEGLKTRVRLAEERAEQAKREAEERAEQAEREAAERVERAQVRARQRGRSNAVQRDDMKRQVARANHRSRADRAENVRLQEAAERASRRRRPR